MGYFFRAIKLSLRYRWTIVASLVNALLIGALWGASITTVYPFVEVVLSGQTAESWLDGQIKTAGESAGQLTREVAELRRRLEQAPPEEIASLESQVSLKSARLVAEEKALGRYRAMEPWIRGNLPATPFATLILVMALLIVATTLKGVCVVLNTVLVARVADRTVVDMRRMFYRRALDMDQATLDRLGTPEIMTQLSYNMGLVGAGLRSLYGTSVREPLKMLACLLAAAMISWRLLVLSLLAAPVGAILIHYLSTRMKRASLAECHGVSSVLQTVMETLDGVKIVKIYGRQRAERRRFKENSQTIYRMGMKMAFYDALIKPVTELTGVLTIVMAILVGAYVVLNQQTHLFGIRISDRPLSASTLFVFYAMLAGVSDPARKMGDIYNVLVRAAVTCRSLYTVFEKPPQVAAPQRPKPVPRHSKEIRFDGVCFDYIPLQRVLHHVTLSIPFGQTVALAGENGCGKSTILNLLARFYDPQKGAIYLDGVDLRELDPKKLRRQMALVTQEPVLFRGTIWDNILYSNPHATREQVLAAARLARVEDFVLELANGYATQVGDRGQALSGGQRQRVALARAILAKPAILILDEATSQIDRQSEELVQDSLREFLHNRTAILVTHRRSTIGLADRVIVMEKGRIVDDLAVEAYLNACQSVGQPLSKAA